MRSLFYFQIPGIDMRQPLTFAALLAGLAVPRLIRSFRDQRGLDLGTALQALAAPLPRPRLRLVQDESLRLDDPERAELLLRVVQEALTNAARHGNGDLLQVELARDAERGGLRLTAEDNGKGRGPLTEGNGLAGMRERIEGAGGTLQVTRTVSEGVRIEAWLPA